MVGLQGSGTRPSYLLVMRPQARGDQVTEPTPKRKRIGCGERDQGDGEPKGKVGMRGLQTNLVVELWQLHLHLLSLKQMVLCLFTHRRDQIELSGHGIGLLHVVRKR